MTLSQVRFFGLLKSSDRVNQNSDQDFADFMREIVGGDFLDFFADDLIATLMTPWVQPPADEKARESMAARPTKMVFPDGIKPERQTV